MSGNDTINISNAPVEQQTMQQLSKSACLSGGSMAYLDSLYEDYLADPDSVSEEWRAYFKELPRVNGTDKEISHQSIREYFASLPYQKKTIQTAAGALDEEAVRKQIAVHELVEAYRTYGHREADINPLQAPSMTACPQLQLTAYGLSSRDEQTVFSVKLGGASVKLPLKDIIAELRTVYCGTVGAEYQYISDPVMVTWIRNRMESSEFRKPFTAERQKQLLKSLTAAEGLEKYLGSRYVGQKRFSVEGAESLLPMMQAIVEKAGEKAVKEVIVGMAHRGRLNILVNLLGKSPKDLFGEFEGNHPVGLTGDVKYHAGFSSAVPTQSGNIVHLAMGFNPSHLEIIGPVVEGSVRARQHRRHDTARETVVPVLIHGDAAFAGQGVVMESLNFSQTRGYTTGGTVRIIVNNQIGFTTSDPHDARSSYYCSDLAKMIESPVFHVNADDPEMAVRVVELAFEFRMQFKRDVIIDLVCYRRHGHNEADEPAMTQPTMYEIIKKMPTVRQKYAGKTIESKTLNTEEAENMALAYRDTLDRGDSPVKTIKEAYEGRRYVDWSRYRDHLWNESVDTAVKSDVLSSLAKALLTVPENFTLHPVIKKLFAEYEKIRQGELEMNWGYAENLAYATLINENYSVRLSGQDCGRGTFSHRHAVLHDFKNGDCYIPLTHISKAPEAFTVIDSLLSEEAVLGFEYGYASTEPAALDLWEAQFGDFANGAQVVVDQFLSSGEQKWGQLAGLVMLLPHGQEGQGPEHSSARLERYLQLCAQDNMQVCVPTTPAQIFHLLRRQMLRSFRKPLIVMTPKSLLRHKLAVSKLEDLSSGGFQLVVPEMDKLEEQSVRKIVLCTGKVYYDLLQKRREKLIKDIAIIRIEQLYPFPEEALKSVLSKYTKAAEIVWCQEEPENQGAWFFVQRHLSKYLQSKQTLVYAGTPCMAAPAVGSVKLFMSQQAAFIEEALKL